MVYHSHFIFVNMFNITIKDKTVRLTLLKRWYTKENKIILKRQKWHLAAGFQDLFHWFIIYYFILFIYSLLSALSNSDVSKSNSSSGLVSLRKMFCVRWCKNTSVNLRRGLTWVETYTNISIFCALSKQAVQTYLPPRCVTFAVFLFLRRCRAAVSLRPFLSY